MLRNDLPLTARSAQDIAWYCFQIGKPEMGLHYASQAAAGWRDLEQPALEAQALSIHAWLHLELGQMEEAVTLAAEALDIADHSGDLRSRSLAINVTGVIFWMSRQPPLAIDYCGRAVALAREAGDASFECWWLINLGGSHAEAAYLALEMGDRASFDAAIGPAIDATRSAYSLAQSLGDGWAERLCLGNLAEYFNAAEDFIGAEQFLAHFRAITSEDDARGEGHYLDILGRTLVSLKRYEEALVPLQHAYALATVNGNVETLMFACLYLSKAHEHLGAFEQALDFHKRYHSLHQQFTAERTQRNARLADIRYETKKLRMLLDTEAGRTAEIARSFEALQQQTTILTAAANTDPLTGLGNRRRLEAMLDTVDASCDVYALAILDVDHFKTINDTHSHIIGDRVLIALGALIKASARGSDLAVRFGGEEFVVLMVGVTSAQAKRAGERIRLKVARHDWSAVAAGLAVTISIGIAVSGEGDDAPEILQIADRNLYRAKQAGRNKVVASGDASPVPER
ncbi:diguanylate cyclase (GGDEF)-like protein [Rhizobium sp. PP-F2F-G38]|uniref:tetratricopeptide repeat-containing diguanylate cyclase n=1 Tax=Ferranicluibacter rubi TaxID=2715133 RepID=UPI000D895245|nr:GGDEF domain-containing protein [Ferranicluibacter rubi]PYE32525.1 diguanylate cyclase (GGDEF)-like protein [Rhizobium sp. PP-WC-1G-195]PYE95954.1 diguanylate cyclase (GGDEF)-like protein [Rhizobium sp. PP-F2F-G38]TCP88441.1 diguanylate cyclase (GGDEF)-like protein [Rhizobium sp. PP-CC-2G-626]